MIMNFILWLIMLFAPTKAGAGEWALVNPSNIVIRVIVASRGHILTREDGPWIVTKNKTGIGYIYDPSVNTFSSPASTATIISPR
jgi:hypothetical protein